MNIVTLYQPGKTVLSLEVFPPKTAVLPAEFASLIDRLKDMQPEFISVTYGAGGSGPGRAVETADVVKNECGVEVLAHLTCTLLTRAEVSGVLDGLLEHNVANVLALRGDSPADAAISQTDYRYAKDLIGHIRRHAQFCIAAAAYPEGHPECRDIGKNVEFLQAKCEAGADFAITQVCFANASFYSFLDKMRSKGLSCPVSAGIMPVLSAASLARIGALCAPAIPADLRALLAKYGDKPAEMEKAGIEYAAAQIADLVAHAVDGVHLFTMNRAQPAKEIVKLAGLR